MHYPWWYVPYLTAPLLIGIIAVAHVIISHYAVGGGIFLAFETSFAYKTKNQNYLKYLQTHTRFFMVVTLIFGAVSGVGIWWTIGLVSPLATQVLIHTFVFGWAIEYVTFILEITSLFIFYYYWNKLPPKIHKTIGWIYAISAWLSLVIITGITSFMLSPGKWLTTYNFWDGFLNPQFIGQVVARSGGALVVGMLYVYLHSSFKCNDSNLHYLIIKRVTKLTLLGIILLLIGGILWYNSLIPNIKSNIENTKYLNILMKTAFEITLIGFIAFFIIYLLPSLVTSRIVATFLFVIGTTILGIGEYIRETIRKPYIIHSYILSNQIYTQELKAGEKKGYLESGKWTKQYVLDNFPKLLDNNIDLSRINTLSEKEKQQLGKVIFMYHCNSCHSTNKGYRSIAKLTAEWSEESIKEGVEQLDTLNFFMPPFAGKSIEAELVAKYIISLNPSLTQTKENKK